MKKLNLIPLFFIAVFAFSCKKDSSSTDVTTNTGTNTNITLSSANQLLSVNTNGQVGAANIDVTAYTVSMIIPSTVNRASLSVSFSASASATVSVNNVAQSGAFTGDFTKPVTVTVTAQNGAVSSWTINVITDLEYYGFSGAVTAEKSLTKGFEWYYDQGTSGTYSSINCGPTCATMAAKWADSTFSRTPEQARQTIRSTGGWWYTDDIVTYLNSYGVKTAYTSLPDNYQTIKKYLDKGYILVLCLDNYYMRYNSNLVQHINKFYYVSATGSGHFIVIKGYKQIGSSFYFEAYDPWSIGQTYALDGTLKGKSRYYLSDDLEQATNVWWDYAIIVAPKGKTVTLSDGNGLKVQSVDKIPAQKGA